MKHIEGIDDMLTKEDIREHLGLGRDAVSEIFKSKGFPAIKFGSTLLVPKSKYQEWLYKSCGKFINIRRL